MAGKLIVGPLQKAHGSVGMSKSTGTFAVVASQSAARPYHGANMPASTGQLRDLGGTAAKAVREGDGQIY